MHWWYANPINNFVFFFLRISTRPCLSSVAVELYPDCKLYFSVVQGGSQTSVSLQTVVAWTRIFMRCQTHDGVSGRKAERFVSVVMLKVHGQKEC